MMRVTPLAQGCTSQTPPAAGVATRSPATPCVPRDRLQAGGPHYRVSAEQTHSLAVPVAPAYPQPVGTEAAMARDRRVLGVHTDALLAHVGAFVREHLVLLSSRQAQILGRLQLAIMQTSMAGQHGRVPQAEALERLERYAEQFEHQFEQPFAHHLPPIVAWPALPAGAWTMACLQLKTMIYRALQTMTLAEARIHETKGPAASAQLCANLLSPRLTLAFVYDATRLLFVAAATQSYDDLVWMHERVASLFEAMGRIDADLANMCSERGLAQRPPSPAERPPPSLQAQLGTFAETLLVLSERTQQQSDPMGFWAMTCESFQRLLMVCRMAQAADHPPSTLHQSVSSSIAQMHQLLALLPTPDAPPHGAAPSA